MKKLQDKSRKERILDSDAYAIAELEKEIRDEIKRYLLVAIEKAMEEWVQKNRVKIEDLIKSYAKKVNQK